MTTVQRVAQVFGVGFLIAALAGFVAAGMSMDPHTETAPRALGLFPVNLVHNLIHLVFGVWGLAASRSRGGSRTYCRVSGAVYLVLVVMGFVAPDTFGLVPIGGNDIWLHALLGLPLAYFGFVARDADAPGGTARV